MSAASTGIPPLIERQLLSLDKQIRDVAFIRGAGRFVFAACLLLGSSLLLDAWLDLSGAVRFGLLVAWVGAAGVLLWQGVIRPAFQPISFAALAAVVEKQFPELSERLTSLVELRGADGDEVAPGASSLMQDLLARQTVKALDRITMDHATADRGQFRTAMMAAFAMVFLVLPFGWNSDGYGLLWARFFVPWGNLGWGAAIDLKVLEGDQVAARGTDVNVHVIVTDRRKRHEFGKDYARPIWLNWRNENGSSDSRRLDWDDQSNQFLATLPHVPQSLTYDVTTTGAKSRTFRVDVSDPPSVTHWKMDIEPPAYTGLPAKTLTGVPGEIRVPELSLIRLSVEFNTPVAGAELRWPAVSEDAHESALRPEQKVPSELSIPLELSADRRSGNASVTAGLTGTYSIVAKNTIGLQNNDPSRMLTVIPDLPPQIQLEGDNEPVLARPDDVVELNAEIKDDYGLTAVELHTETSTGNKKVESLPANEFPDGHVEHKFVLDLSQFELQPGQAISYRMRAADNRPHPHPQETWTPTRTLVVNTSLKQLPDRDLAQAEQSLEDELSSLRTELNRNKAELGDLHQEAEKEALNKQEETDKSDRLNQMQNAQDRLIERMQQLADRLSARRMTHDLAPQAQMIAEGDLKTVQDRLEQSKNQPARDQLEPLSRAIDNLATADQRLRQLENQLVDLNKLEQDLAELTRMAQHAERLADQLDKLDAQQKAAANQSQQSVAAQNSDDPNQGNSNQAKPSNEQALTRNEKDPNAAQPQNDIGKNPSKETSPDKQQAAEKAQASTTESLDDSGITRKLKDEASQLSQQMNELLKKHPELLEAARRDQVEQLRDLAEQARKLAGPQERLAEALNEAAANAPAVATRPDNTQAQQPPAVPVPKDADGGAKPADKEDPAGLKNPSEELHRAAEKADSNHPNAANPAEINPQQTATEQTKTDPSDSLEKSNEIQAGDPRKDPTQNPADALEPSVGESASNSEQADKPRENQLDSKTDSKPDRERTPGDLRNDGTANSSSAQKSELNPNAQNQPETNAPSSTSDQPGPKNSHASENPSAQPAAPNAQPPAQNAAQRAGSDATRQQEQIAREATQQALDMARETGADSNATKDAAEFARKADAAKQQAQVGQLAKAAKEAREAAKSADDTARQLDPDGQSNSPKAKQAQNLADKQNAAAKQLESLASSIDAAQGAQLQGQKQLADATSRLAEQMDRAAQSLKSNPLNSPKEAKSGEKASQATKQAQQAMQQAAVANQQNDPLQAAKAATEATQKLKQAADWIPPSPPTNQNPLPVPNNIASQVAEVTKRLDNAQKELASVNKQKPTASDQSSSTSSQTTNPSQAQQTSTQTQKPSSQTQNQNQNPQALQPNEQAGQKGGQQTPAPKQDPTQQDSKPQGQNAQNATPQGQKPQGNQQEQPQQGQAQQNSKPQGQNPQNSNPQGQKPQSNQQGQPQQSQAQQDSKPQGQNPQHGNPQGQKPQGNQQGQPQQSQAQQDSKPQGQNPQNSNPQGQKPQSNQQGQPQQSRTQQDSKPQGQPPQNSNPKGQKSQGDKPGQGQSGSQSQGQGQLDSMTQGQKPQSAQSHGQQRSGEIGQSTKVGNGQQIASTQNPSQLAQVAEQFREIAAMLRQTRGDPKENLKAGQPMQSSRPGQPMPGQVSQQSEPGEGGSNASGTTATPDLGHLDAELQQMARHNWGRLPGQLRTEILQGAGKKSHPEYTQRIKSYFDEITKLSQ